MGIGRFRDRNAAHDCCAEPVFVMAGNPNVGKSSLFNALTGLHQHTGNWTGKTVGCAVGYLRGQRRERHTRIALADLPGCYSLSPRTGEERAALHFLLSSRLYGAVVVCDAQNLERNLPLAFQLEALLPQSRILICVNLIDEAESQGMTVSPQTLEAVSGFRTVLTCARTGRGVSEVRQEILRMMQENGTAVTAPADASIPPAVSCFARARDCCAACVRPYAAPEVSLTPTGRRFRRAPGRRKRHTASGAWLDRVVLGRVTAAPVALLFLALILWITIYGANRPSELLADGLNRLGDRLATLTLWSACPAWVSGLLLDGVYATIARVVAVMLPPMAIFFPLFTLLEDFGFLPRIAFSFDRCFQGCHSCGKQALTMCMGLGCSAVGVTGCRIIDSQRERMIAVLTNAFMPCNGKFATLLVMAAVCLQFAGSGRGATESLLPALLVTAMILLCVLLTLMVSRLLSATLLRGQPSAYLLEIPPYRVPDIPTVLVRSLLDRTLFVLGRAVAAAAPAGAVLWLVSHIGTSDGNLLLTLSAALDPVGAWLCVNGAVLLALTLSLPANELTVPVLLLILQSGGNLTDAPGAGAIGVTLSAAGWDIWNCIGFLCLFLFHIPCATTLLTVRRETGSLRWTLLAAALPLAVGIVLCLLLSALRALLS